ncbi:protein of unknown function [Xenorhabdus poinarii G6]|uniref:Uncharacterized protein n=1 Tax=Xenorhabdus poinarii G6 TaxID=1354304 RepID=A0A068R1J9_9GAMM|nr:protein of unknown function [Xenorhabdus poinarii G6]
MNAFKVFKLLWRHLESDGVTFFVRYPVEMIQPPEFIAQ